MVCSNWNLFELSSYAGEASQGMSLSEILRRRNLWLIFHWIEMFKANSIGATIWSHWRQWKFNSRVIWYFIVCRLLHYQILTSFFAICNHQHALLIDKGENIIGIKSQYLNLFQRELVSKQMDISFVHSLLFYEPRFGEKPLSLDTKVAPLRCPIFLAI